MSLIERCPVCGRPDVCCGQRDMLATQVLALENVGMDQAERLGEAEHQLAGAVVENERLREVLRAVLMEPDPIKRNQLAAAVLTNPGGSSIPGA